jgi:hypothetical protein
MLTVEQMNYGLGLGLRGNGRTLRFGHDGANAGFNAVMSAYAYAGKGAAVMINKNDDGKAMSQIFNAIGEQYHWSDYKVPPEK